MVEERIDDGTNLNVVEETIDDGTNLNVVEETIDDGTTWSSPQPRLNYFELLWSFVTSTTFKLINVSVSLCGRRPHYY